MMSLNSLREAEKSVKDQRQVDTYVEVHIKQKRIILFYKTAVYDKP